jgi:NAD(P)-dependent dehydrogenase (short-subunit alcohol dehydrogenase family)
MTMRQQVYHFRQSVDYHFEGKVALIAVNLKGVFLGMKYEIPAMLASGGGAIVNLSSTVGLVGTGAGIAPYIASKHGVVGLTKAAALEMPMPSVLQGGISSQTDIAQQLVGRGPTDLHPCQTSPGMVYKSRQ